MNPALRCTVLAALAAAGLICAPGGAGAAESYPAKPIRLIVGFSAGGANDLVARAVATRLSPRLGQQIVVENRPGAGGNIATELVARAAPDGYTMLLASVASFAMSPALLGKVPFDPLSDFAPITQAVWVTSLLSVHPSMPVKSLKQLVALAKSQPGKLNYASPGTGSIAHLASELLFHTAGVKLNHVPYKGGAPAAADAIARRADGRRIGLSRIRGERVAGPGVSRQDAEADRGPRQQGSRGGARHEGSTGSARRPRPGCRVERSRRLSCPHQVRLRALGQARAGSRSAGPEIGRRGERP
jgi:tripartite-type tricarboxylate transporter receptor subunit TctC